VAQTHFQARVCVRGGGGGGREVGGGGGEVVEGGGWPRRTPGSRLEARDGCHENLS
jgi:hypothetical protein